LTLFTLCSLYYQAHRNKRGVIRRPVSRVLSTACGKQAAGWPFLWDVRRRTPRATDPDDRPGNGPALRREPSSLLGLAPGGVCPARTVTGPAVRSYRTLSPLPLRSAWKAGALQGGLLSVALSLRSPSPGVTRHRVSMEPGLSSPETSSRAAIQPPDPVKCCRSWTWNQDRMSASMNKV